MREHWWAAGAAIDQIPGYGSAAAMSAAAMSVGASRLITLFEQCMQQVMGAICCRISEVMRDAATTVDELGTKRPGKHFVAIPMPEDGHAGPQTRSSEEMLAAQLALDWKQLVSCAFIRQAAPMRVPPPLTTS